MLKHDALIHILADDREPEGEVIRSLAEVENVAVEIRRLSLGDYRIDKRVIVERKTLKDFAVSIVDGRLFKQMIRLANSNLKGVLILEGGTGETAGLGVTREALQGALISVSLILGIPVLRAKDAAETAKLMIYIARQLKTVSGGVVHRAGYRPKTKGSRQLFILQGLPGVGHERAKKLLTRFGSVEGVISAGSEELQTVPGIGKKAAEKIRWAVNEAISAYEAESDFNRQAGEIPPCSSLSKRGIGSCLIDRKGFK